MIVNNMLMAQHYSARTKVAMVLQLCFIFCDNNVQGK